MPALKRLVRARLRAVLVRSSWFPAVGAVALLLAAVGDARPLGAQRPGAVLSLIATDSSGAPLSGVRVQIVELGRSGVTSREGRLRFGALPAGAYTVSLSRLGLAPEAKRVALDAGELTLAVRMREARIALAPVQVTASTVAGQAAESPQSIAVLEGAELRVSQGSALGDVLEQIPGVRSLTMTTGIGKPVIRGMTHYRVVTLDNGQRSETQAWGHDHSPNVETATSERVEVIKGPASVLYGSDALGGVVNVIAPAIPDALDGPSFVRGRAITAYNHNIRGGDGSLVMEGATGGLGVRGAVTARSSGDMRTPAGRLRNTNNRAVATEGAAGYRGAWGSLQARYAGRDERIEIFDDPVASPGYTGFQRIDTHRGTLEWNAPVRGARLQVNTGYEQNFRREFAADTATQPDLGLLVRNWTGFAHLHHAPVGPFRGTLGVSAMSSHFENRGSETLIPNSDTYTAAAYLFEEVERGPWQWTLGARYDWRVLATDGQAQLGLAAQQRDFHAVTGSAGARYRLTDAVALVVSTARGFRAPSAPDLWANGFHEGTRAFERGDPTLGVETSLNTDVGVRLSRHDLTAELTGFVNLVDNYIYLRPYGAGGGVFDSLQVAQGDARLRGMEARIAYRPILPLTLQLSGDYVRGDNVTAGVPLTFIPPMRVLYGARLESMGTRAGLHRPYVTVSGETNARQNRLDPRDVAPPGYTLATVGAGFSRVVPRGALTVDLTLRNALDARYRSFLSRYKEFADGPGRTLVLRVTSPL